MVQCRPSVATGNSQLSTCFVILLYLTTSFHTHKEKEANAHRQKHKRKHHVETNIKTSSQERRRQYKYNITERPKIYKVIFYGVAMVSFQSLAQHTFFSCPLLTASMSAFCRLLGADPASVSPPVELGERGERKGGII